MKIDMLRTFYTVAQSGNLADAANRLARTQSALSMSLKQFEAHLGQRLFVSDRKNQLTLFGERVFELAQAQLRQFDETVDAIEMSARAPEGLVRIVTVPSVSGLVLPQAIGQLVERHPSVHVELRDSDTQHVIDALVQGIADVGVASGRHTLAGVIQIPLFEDQFGLICSAQHPLARQAEPPHIEDVLESRFIRNNLCAMIDSPAIQAAVAQARVTVYNTSSLIGMLSNGEWTTLLPRTVTRVLPEMLAFRAVAGLDDVRPVCLLIRERSPYVHLATELADLIVAQCQLSAASDVSI